MNLHIEAIFFKRKKQCKNYFYNYFFITVFLYNIEKDDTRERKYMCGERSYIKNIIFNYIYGLFLSSTSILFPK